MMYPPTKCVAVDVDGTLIRAGVINQRVVEWCRRQKAKGNTMILWSMRGEEYARRAAALPGVPNLLAVITIKGGLGSGSPA
jgi:hydroxymethylpyrimidine pyrophosphatase-like HAD family hydrolase